MHINFKITDRDLDTLKNLERFLGIKLKTYYQFISQFMRT